MTIALINPANGLPLTRRGERLCDPAGQSFPIVGEIPRLCDAANYADNFGLQWNRFATTQIDRPETGQRQSEVRFFAATGWTPETLDGVDLLEVGSGAGRFSRVILERTKARLWSVDYSSAVEANARNNAAIADGRFKLCQASIYELPFLDSSFDKIVCLGVLQHTPDFEDSVGALVAKAKPGGEIVVDFYPVRGFWTWINAKYLLRPITRRLSHDRLLGLIERHSGWLMRVTSALRRVRLGALTRFVPIVDERLTLPIGLSEAEKRQWVVLDTFDMFSPEHDHPQRVADVAAMFERAGAQVSYAGFVDVGGGARAAVVRAVKV